MNIGDKARIRNMIEVLTAIDKGYPVETKRIKDDKWAHFNYNKDIYLEDALFDYRVAPKERLLFTPFTTAADIYALQLYTIYSKGSKDAYNITCVKLHSMPLDAFTLSRKDMEPIIIVKIIKVSDDHIVNEITLSSLFTDYVNKDGYPIGRITYKVKEDQYRCCTTLIELLSLSCYQIMHKATGKEYIVERIDAFGANPNITLLDISTPAIRLHVYSYMLFTDFVSIQNKLDGIPLGCKCDE